MNDEPVQDRNVVTGGIGTISRGKPWLACSEESKDQAFTLWATVCGQDSAATERMMQEIAAEGEVVPTRQTVARWAREEGWAERAADGWRNVGGRTVFELRVAMLSNVVLAQRVKRNAMTGAYDENVPAGALRLKAAELSDRLLERAVIALGVPEAPVEAMDESQLTRQEREALANERMAQCWQERQ